MPTFTNVTSTSATPEPGFLYSAYAGQITDALDSIRQAALTVATADPWSQNITASVAQFGYANGTELDAQIASRTATSVVFSRAEITAADGSSIDLTGSAKMSLSKSGDIVAAPAKLTRLDYGNEEAMQILNGALKLDPNTGVLTGRLTSITLAFSNDNPATSAHEWDYVTLTGRVGLSGNLTNGLQSLTGKFAGVDWGTMSTTANGATSFSSEGAVSGLKIDAATLLSGLQSSGFDALKAGLYSGNDTIDGTAGADLLDAGTGNDKVYGEDGDDTIRGGAGNDQLFGGAGNDIIDGGAGNDKITDDAGHNTITDLEGNANIVTGGGNDTITTGAGNDKIAAGDGANVIRSGAGNDTIITGGGADWINGGQGADKLTGGGGADVFVFDNLAVGGKDAIMDFNASEDVFAFDTGVFTKLAGGISAENFVIGKVALDADDYLIFDTSGGKLYYDADGSGGGAAIQIAGVKGALAGLSADSFADADLMLA
ncbi:calcium-binding protein [Aromatoleum evansii]|uniref:calcium-binding protein n=1 Tax=Aromatoleum evansii TaxID=59406 RepID=UPI00145E9F02|nr:calcium-binding protein [Aromatoleum evansii]NMG29533.1 calcium-binding protein [Aromatoleum evansii]